MRHHSASSAAGHGRGSWIDHEASAAAAIAAAEAARSYDAYVRAGQRSTSPRDPTAFRVTLVGPVGCGKTCILRRVFTASNEAYVPDTEPTIGEEGYQADINGQPITVIDLSGDETFLDNIHENLQHTNLLLAVIDASQPMSSVSLMARMLKKLIDLQRSRPDQNELHGLCTWLIVNKCDLTSVEWECGLTDNNSRDRLTYIRDQVRTSHYREFTVCCHGNDSLARHSAERLRDAVVAYHTSWVYSCRNPAPLSGSSGSISTATSNSNTPQNNLSRSSSANHNGSSGILHSLELDSPSGSPRSPTISPHTSGRFSPGRSGGCVMQ